MEEEVPMRHRLALLLFACTLVPCFAAPGRPAAEKEQAQAPAWTKSLDKETVRRAMLDHESDPLAPEAKTKLAPILLAHFEDVPFNVCLDQVPGLTEEGELGKALLWQMVFASGVFIEEHPERAGDREAYMLAGLESAVRAYRNVREKNPRRTIGLFETLDAMEQKGSLVEHVRAHPCQPKPS
jgi:hypothetical protein